MIRKVVIDAFLVLLKFEPFTKHNVSFLIIFSNFPSVNYLGITKLQRDLYCDNMSVIVLNLNMGKRVKDKIMKI